MQIEIKIKPRDNEIISHDYLYSMSTMLKNVLSQIAPEFSTELHAGIHQNKIKLFTFSPLNSFPGPKSVQIEGEKRKQMLLGQRIWFRIASPWPELLNALGQALLTNNKIRIMSKKFKVEAINMIAPPEMKETMVWRPFGQSASICTPWSSRTENKKSFVYPDKSINNSPECASILKQNLIHKFQRLQEIRKDIATAWIKSAEIDKIDKNTPIEISFIPYSKDRPYKQVMHKGKNTPIRTWRCPVKITAPIPIQRLIWATGLGAMNSQGYGLVQEGKNAN
ncbi:MAG: CRISPR-associated endoribonuclease Cas6 [Verrucomicrobiota bacterium]|nr:CRISPR-associated endoribonuclease Cas6 [Verrucomicrobiota bacterium]